MSKPPSKIRAIVCGLDQLDCYSSTGITHVLSILDPECPDPQVFKTYQPHCRTILRFHDDIEPGPNIILPTIDHIERILSLGRSMSDLEKDGKLHSCPLPNGHLAFDRRDCHSPCASAPDPG